LRAVKGGALWQAAAWACRPLAVGRTWPTLFEHRNACPAPQAHLAVVCGAQGRPRLLLAAGGARLRLVALLLPPAGLGHQLGEGPAGGRSGRRGGGAGVVGARPLAVVERRGEAREAAVDLLGHGCRRSCGGRGHEIWVRSSVRHPARPLRRRRAMHSPGGMGPAERPQAGGLRAATTVVTAAPPPGGLIHACPSAPRKRPRHARRSHLYPCGSPKNARARLRTASGEGRSSAERRADGELTCVFEGN
jgi:hypothetical protein